MGTPWELEGSLTKMGIEAGDAAEQLTRKDGDDADWLISKGGDKAQYV